ncbi:MAG: hypothetical protein Q4C63_05015 [Eubacteriales bacterium]|nr:hypothetical protein [Eubacteriales bacterium]
MRITIAAEALQNENSPKHQAQDDETLRTAGLQAFLALRAQAQKNGIQDLSLDEINEEIRKTRYKES